MNSLFLIALIAQPAIQPSSQPASQAAPSGGRPNQVQAELTLIVEPSEGWLNVQESWKLTNEGSASIDAGLEVPLPAGANKVQLDDDVAPFGLTADKRTPMLESPLPPGTAHLSGAYQVPLHGDAADLSRTIPFALRGARIVSENLPGLSFDSNLPHQSRSRELNDVTFTIWDVEGAEAGAKLEIQIAGFPSRSTWPRNLTIVICALILIWMIVALLTGRAPGALEEAPSGILSAEARCERILKALEIVDADFEKKKVTAKQRDRRRKVLMTDLAAAMKARTLETEAQSD